MLNLFDILGRIARAPEITAAVSIAAVNRLLAAYRLKRATKPSYPLIHGSSGRRPEASAPLPRIALAGRRT